MNRLRCVLGLHDWRYVTMAISFQLAFPDEGHVLRRCGCGALEYLASDGRSWELGLTGIIRYEEEP